MEAARERYKKGERRTMKNWRGVRDLPEFYGDQIQIIKDVVTGSHFDVGSQWPAISLEQAKRSLLKDAGVLFADAGRTRNPCYRTEATQIDIASYTHEMLKKYLAVYVTVKPEQWSGLLDDLQQKAKLVQRAAMWAMQPEFVADPVFINPVVDICRQSRHKNTIFFSGINQSTIISYLTAPKVVTSHQG